MKPIDYLRMLIKESGIPKDQLILFQRFIWNFIPLTYLNVTNNLANDLAYIIKEDFK